MKHTDVAIVGSGPIGLELAIACKKNNIDTLLFDKGQIAQTILRFPPQMRFFSSNERIALADVPIQTPDQSKCTREEYLAYLRSLVVQFDLDIKTFEKVNTIQKQNGQFLLRTSQGGSEHRYSAERVVLVTGGTAKPRKLGIPGEDLPHVSHVFSDPHRYFRRRLLIVGGRNSAVEAALRCHNAFADVAMSYRRDRFDPSSVKYWLLPELKGRIHQKEIRCDYRSQPVRITPTCVTLKNLDNLDTFEVPADDVLVAIGFEADMSLIKSAGVELIEDSQKPVYDEDTMLTHIEGLYVAGTAVAGTQDSYKVFLENCHIHVDRIIASITGAAPPPPPSEQQEPET